MQEALTEQYNDQLRELREAGMSESSAEFRDVVRELRDEERAPLDAVQVSDRPVIVLSAVQTAFRARIEGFLSTLP